MHRFDCSEAFGSKIVTENIPGTPMEPNEIPMPNNSGGSTKIVDPTNPSTTILNEISEQQQQRRSSIDSRVTKTLTPVTDLNQLNNKISQPPPNDCSNTLLNNQYKENNLNNYVKRSSLVTSEGGGSDLDYRNSIGKINNDVHRNSKQDQEGIDPESLMFRDGRRKIDMVLCYEEETEGVMTEVEAKRVENRRIFLENLMKEGLELEIEDKMQSFDEKTYFVKVHMPWKTETRYAEVLNLKLPVKRFITISVKAWVKLFIKCTTNYCIYVCNILFQIGVKFQAGFVFLFGFLNIFLMLQDEEKNDVLKLNRFRRWLRKFQKMIELDAMLVETEPTFYKATAGGNPEEQ